MKKGYFLKKNVFPLRGIFNKIGEQKDASGPFCLFCLEIHSVSSTQSVHGEKNR